MFADYDYLPYVRVRPSELDGIQYLPAADKDRMLPIIGLRRWRGSKDFSAIEKKLELAFGHRPCVAYPCVPEKIECPAEARISDLLEPANGFSNWLAFVSERPQYIPTILHAGATGGQILREIASLVDLGRPMALCIDYADEKIPQLLELVSQIDFNALPLLIIVNYGQIYQNTNIPLVSAALVGLAKGCLARIGTAKISFMFAASSFPIEFASIDRATARLPIRERQLSEMIVSQISDVASVIYGDYASVYAGPRGFSQGGAPRVDFPTRTRWIYYRRDEGTFADAAKSIMADPAWEDNLLIWGTERIRQAANGDLAGLHYAQAWTTVRIHLHMHQQIHFNGPSGSGAEIEELWAD